MKKIYRFRPGLSGRPSPSLAQAAGEEYERLKGFETRKQLQIIKKNTRSILHKLVFIKNQAAAAEEFYLDRLGEVVRHLIEIEVETRHGRKGQNLEADVSIGNNPRAFVSIASEGADVKYFARDEVRDNPTLRARHVEQAIRELELWIQSFEPFKYKELTPLIQSVKRALTKHGR
jgi:hypothetical protein